MAAVRNVFACLVHESPECVADLVRNLRHLDPSSEVLLYNGGKNGPLLAGFPFERYGAVVHPSPQPLEWGRLHDFALDCLRFCLDRSGFDTLTIVDSDQLAVRPGYSEHLARALAGRSGIGLFGSSAGPQPRPSQIGPVAAAQRELDLWRPWLRRFRGGEEKLFHWTFWPSTVFTADAARDLLQLLARDARLQEILRQTRIWATEEVILPTLVALLGYEVADHPCSYDFVQYKQAFSRQQIEEALARPDVFWLHPVPRRYDDPLRTLVRERFGHYRIAAADGAAPAAAEAPGPGLLVTLPILARMRQVPGWLEDEEGDLLLAAASRALTELPAPHAVVEVGSHCGRATVVLGSAVQALRPAGRVWAIDPHLGQIGALDRGLQTGRPTFEKLRANVAAAGLAGTIEIVRQHSFEVDWERPISLLLIDGLHDYVNVARDFFHFEAAVVPGGYVAFHDYADYYPGVRTFVDELLAGGLYRKVHLAKSLMVVQKLATSEARPPATAVPIAADAGDATLGTPLVSCIMPTRDRRDFVPQAVRQFLRQDWPNAELIVVDDGDDKAADLIPPHPRIRYLALDGRRTVGAKRNLACEAARGEIILHWDDDDWMADWRIRYQVEHLLAAEADLCGLPRLYFHEPATGKAWEYSAPAGGSKWIAGATFCYRKDLWRDAPFADVDNGEDTGFLWSGRRKKVSPLKDPGFYIARLHDGNTASKRESGGTWRPVSPTVLAGLMTGLEGKAPRLPHPSLPPRSERAGRPRPTSRPEIPLVSCVMPTRGRPELALRAVRYFLDQDYPERELVIVDDGAEPLAVPEDGRIRYIRPPGPLSLGRKRNLGVERSRGAIVLHWDDDDWYAPDRIRYQVQPLLAGEADVAGLIAEHFYSVQGARFWGCTPQLHARMFFADVHGRSIAYLRRIWEDGVRYPDLSLAEDARFLQGALARRGRLARLPNPDKLLYVRHGANTWQFECGRFLLPDAWQAREVPGFLPQEDLAFYRALAAGDGARGYAGEPAGAGRSE